METFRELNSDQYRGKTSLFHANNSTFAQSAHRNLFIKYFTIRMLCHYSISTWKTFKYFAMLNKYENRK